MYTKIFTRFGTLLSTTLVLSGDPFGLSTNKPHGDILTSLFRWKVCKGWRTHLFIHSFLPCLNRRVFLFTPVDSMFPFTLVKTSPTTVGTPYPSEDESYGR